MHNYAFRINSPKGMRTFFKSLEKEIFSHLIVPFGILDVVEDLISGLWSAKTRNRDGALDKSYTR